MEPFSAGGTGLVLIGEDQCDQVAIYNNENAPSSIKMPKLGQKFAKYKISH